MPDVPEGAMTGFAAIILICLSTVPVADCDQSNAVEVRSIRVDNELGCYYGWQEVIARGPQGREVGTETYLKTLCERIKPTTKAAAPSSPLPR